MAGSKDKKNKNSSTGKSVDRKNSLSEPFELEWTEYSKADYDSLDGSQLIFVDKALNRIRLLGMEAGVPLTRELIGCRKLKHRKLGLRIVFRQSEKGIQIIQIVAIGSRGDSVVYNQSKARLL